MAQDDLCYRRAVAVTVAVGASCPWDGMRDAVAVKVAIVPMARWVSGVAIMGWEGAMDGQPEYNS